MTGVTVPRQIERFYEIHEWRNALPILVAAHPDEWKDVLTVLTEFRLLRNDVLAPGGRKSRIANKLDAIFIG